MSPVYSNPNNGIASSAEEAGGDAFDLSDVGLDRLRFIRIRDVGLGSVMGNVSGFDLDAISAIHWEAPLLIANTSFVCAHRVATSAFHSTLALMRWLCALAFMMVPVFAATGCVSGDLGADGEWSYFEDADGGVEPDASTMNQPIDTSGFWPRNIDMHRLFEDEDISGNPYAVTIDQVRDFLEYKGSYLATFMESDRLAAQIITEQAAVHNINPVYILARIETESGGVRSAEPIHVEKATGCGCPDGSGCDPLLAGFANQVDCAANLMRRYWNDLEGKGLTVSGWQVGVQKMTFDPCWVTPQNNATAALYTYTPWVGAYAEQCGTSMWGGSSLVARLYYMFLSEYPWGIDP